jgi:pimeloyl-ACP methyl ester carboxylesterase
VEQRIRSDGIQLAAHVARPPGRPSGPVPAVVLCHGYPSAATAATAPETMPELADRIAGEMGWTAVAVAYRGCGESEGQFSLGGWLDDIAATVGFVEETLRPLGIWLAGFGTGGALAICAAARDERVLGVAAVGAPGDFDDWASAPRRLLEHGREVGVITDDRFPPSLDAWSRELRDIRAVACVADYAPRPLLVIHGADDDVVPPFDARIVADAHGSAELRFINGAGHGLRHDPRTIAVLLGWLDRQRHALRL